MNQATRRSIRSRRAGAVLPPQDRRQMFQSTRRERSRRRRQGASNGEQRRKSQRCHDLPMQICSDAVRRRIASESFDTCRESTMPWRRAAGMTGAKKLALWLTGHLDEGPKPC